MLVLRFRSVIAAANVEPLALSKDKEQATEVFQLQT